MTPMVDETSIIKYFPVIPGIPTISTNSCSAYCLFFQHFLYRSVPIVFDKFIDYFETVCQDCILSSFSCTLVNWFASPVTVLFYCVYHCFQLILMMSDYFCLFSFLQFQLERSCYQTSS